LLSPVKHSQYFDQHPVAICFSILATGLSLLLTRPPNVSTRRPQISAIVRSPAYGRPGLVRFGAIPDTRHNAVATQCAPMRLRRCAGSY
jgi:hypothetical protein